MRGFTYISSSPTCCTVLSTGYSGTLSGGGFIATLGATREEATQTLQELFDAGWLDQNSRVVALEVSAYTANVNLLTLLTAITEKPSVTGIFHGKQITSLKLYRSTHSLHVFILIFEIVYCLYTLYFIYYEARRIAKLKRNYFKNPWHILEFLTIASSLVIIGLYAAHAVESNKAIATFQAGGSPQTKFQLVLTMDNAMNNVFGLLVTLGMIKFLHLLRFNPMIYKFAVVLRTGASSESIYMGLFIVSCFLFGGLMQELSGFRTPIFKDVPTALKTLFLATMGDFDIAEVRQVHSFFGPLLFFMFVFVAIAILFNFFITVLILAHQVVRKNPQPSEDAEMLWLLIDQIKQWLGLRSRKQWETQLNKAASKLSQDSY